MRVFLTGAAGFIGSWTCEALLARGDEVVGFDNFDPFYARSIKEENLRSLRSAKHFTFIEGDILASKTLDQIFTQPFDAIIHLAALAGVRPSIHAPDRYMRINVEGTTMLLEASRRCASIHKIVVASSSSIYGTHAVSPFSEEGPHDFPISPYAASKKATELVCATYHHLYGIPISCMRYFTAFGPRQRPEMAIHKFFRFADAGVPIVLYGDGNTGRDYTFISDIVAGTLAALDAQSNGYRIYNLGGSIPVRLKDVVQGIGKVMGKPLRVEYEPTQPGDVEWTCADVSRAQKELGFAPKVTFEEGLSRFWKWYVTNKK